MTELSRQQKFRRALAAASDVLERYHAGAQFNQETVDWARDMHQQHVVLKKQPVHGSPLQDKVAAAFDVVIPAGLQLADVHRLTGIRHALLSQTLAHMVKNGRLFQVKVPRRTRYFPTAEARDAGEPLVRAQEALLLASGKKEPPPRPAKAPPPPKKQKPLQDVRRAHNIDQTIFRPKVIAKPPASGSVFIPDHVQVQVIPAFEDRRFKADGTGEAGFLAEWKKLRGES